MNDSSEKQSAPKHRWPWLVLAGVILGVILFALWVWYAAKGVKRIKESTTQMGALHIPQPTRS